MLQILLYKYVYFKFQKILKMSLERNQQVKSIKIDVKVDFYLVFAFTLVSN